MAESYEVQIADAVVKELNTATRGWLVPFTAERTWHPVYRADDLALLRVAVVPLTLSQQLIDRAARHRFDYGIAIDLQRRVDPDGRAEIDALTRTAEQVQDFFLDGHNLASLTTAKVLEATREDLYDLDRLHYERTWETLIVLSVKVSR